MHTADAQAMRHYAPKDLSLKDDVPGAKQWAVDAWSPVMARYRREG